MSTDSHLGGNSHLGGKVNQIDANDQGDLFTTETAGLPEVSRPAVIRLEDGDRLDLRIGPVRKNIDGAELRILGYNGSIPARSCVSIRDRRSPCR
jgi:hypothetical protein